MGINNAFIGVSLDSKLFTREWIARAVKTILEKHDRLLFLLADDLLRYTRSSVCVEGSLTVDFPSASAMVRRRSQEIESFINSVILKLPTATNRVTVSRWADYSDSFYISVHRSINIAYVNISSFADCVNTIAESHLIADVRSAKDSSKIKSSVLYILDEIAMCLRVSELGDYHNEYYPDDEIRALTLLYRNDFACSGLSVSTLTGVKIPSRTFRTLP